MAIVNRILLIILAIASIAMALFAFTYLSFNPDHGLLADKEPLIKAQWLWNAAFYIHVMGGIVAIVVGPWQFFKKFRERSWWRHRLLGRIYVYAILIASPLGFYTALFANEGFWSQAGFAMLAVAWFITTYIGYRFIRRKNQYQHERWMIRSFAVTFAAVSFRFWLGIEYLMGIPFDTSYILNTWLCWIGNLAIAELIIRLRSSRVMQRAGSG